jgi:hypothetical protein
MKETCAMLSTTKMHANGLKTSAKNDTASSANDVRKGTMITMALTMTNPTSTAL